MNKIRETVDFLWGVVRNKPLEWTDTATGELVESEQMTRADRWSTFRPLWTHTIFTTNPGCGCRKRLGVRPTIWCMKHAFEETE